MAINKVIYGNDTLIDLTSDTATEDKVLSGYTFHKASGEVAVGTASGGGGDIPNGKTVTPTDDIQTWLHCAGIFDNEYTTLAEVLNDPIVYNALLSDSNACDYMARSTSWAIATGLVPILTSDTGSNGYCIKSSISPGYYAYHVFDDDSATVWYGSSNLNEYVGYHFDSPTVVNMIKFKSINASNIIRIKEYEIRGSNDGGTTWVKLAEGTYANNVHEEVVYIPDNTMAYSDIVVLGKNNYTSSVYGIALEYVQFYSADITTSQDAMRILGKYDYACEALLSVPVWKEAICKSEYVNYVLNINVPQMTSATTPNGTVLTNSLNTTYPAWKAFDATLNSTFWATISGTVTNAYLGYDFGEPVNIRIVGIINSSYNTNYYIQGVKDFDIKYSDDGTNWTIAYSGTATKATSLSQGWEYFDLSSLGLSAHRYWIIYCKNNYGDAYNMSISQLQFYGRTPVNKPNYVPLVPTMTSNTTPSGECISSGRPSASYDFYKAFDNDSSTLWQNINSTYEGAYIGYHFPSSVVVKKIWYRSRGQSGVTSNATGKIQGSNDGNIWTDLSDTLSFKCCDSSQVEYTWDINNNTAYSYYRLYFLTGSNPSQVSPCVNELQFYRLQEPEPAIIHCATDDEITIVGDDVERTIYAYGDTATLPADIPSGLYTFTSAVLSNPSYPDQPYTQNVYITENTTEIYFMPENMEIVLWTNSSPTSTFAAQNVTLSDSIDNYKYIKISYRVSNSNSETSSVIMSVEDLKNTDTFSASGLTYGSMSGNGYKVRDFYYISDTSISFTQGYQINAVATDNNSCIPIEITGLNKLRTGKKSSKTTTTLWTNPSPSASAGFASQNVTLSDSISNYDYIEFEFFQNVAKMDDIVIAAFPTDQLKNKLVGSNWYGSSITIFAGNYYYTRYIRCDSETSILISSGLKSKSGSSGSTFATSIIPNKIYGIKYA